MFIQPYASLSLCPSSPVSMSPIYLRLVPSVFGVCLIDKAFCMVLCQSYILLPSLNVFYTYNTVTPGLYDTSLSENITCLTLCFESPSLSCVQSTLIYLTPGLSDTSYEEQTWSDKQRPTTMCRYYAIANDALYYVLKYILYCVPWYVLGSTGMHVNLYLSENWGI